MSSFRLLAFEGKARRGVFVTPHGTVQTPAFMNVATCGAIKGGVSAYDLRTLGCQVQLCNTYHLHLRPGEDVLHQLGGLRSFTGWDGPILTDSGGFQVFSLARLRNIREDGVTFASHISGEKIFMGPEESIQIQSALGSTIAMAFDECVENPAEFAYAEAACARTYRWLLRCKEQLKRCSAVPGAVNPLQLLFGINQGCTYDALRLRHMEQIAALELDGYAIGGLAVGEPKEDMYRVISIVEPVMPQGKPRYLMGVGTPGNILEAVRRGMDLFDCVMPSRNARHGHLFTRAGVMNLNNAKYERDPLPIDPTCGCPVCQGGHSRAYLRHLRKAGELLALRLCVMHNLWFYNHLMAEIREAITQERFTAFHAEHAERLDRRI
ncbi:MAG: tRNA guanosine(34) transglycosylase Tgt [Oscillospiraceae bacterium]|jgi:queuine tRNA-ribosyltransferase|nr:tRNA guanosine(34) transglycosylase Tgt [Oscillospiraceae bacterium]